MRAFPRHTPKADISGTSTDHLPGISSHREREIFNRLSALVKTSFENDPDRAESILQTVSELMSDISERGFAAQLAFNRLEREVLKAERPLALGAFGFNYEWFQRRSAGYLTRFLTSPSEQEIAWKRAKYVLLRVFPELEVSQQGIALIEGPKKNPDRLRQRLNLDSNEENLKLAYDLTRGRLVCPTLGSLERAWATLIEHFKIPVGYVGACATSEQSAIDLALSPTKVVRFKNLHTKPPTREGYPKHLRGIGVMVGLDQQLALDLQLRTRRFASLEVLEHPRSPFRQIWNPSVEEMLWVKELMWRSNLADMRELASESAS